MQMNDGYIVEYGEDGTITYYYDDELKEIEEQKRSRQEKEKIERERLDFKQFRLGFTTATGFLVFLFVLLSEWNTALGASFFIIFYYIPAILYVYLADDSIKYYKLYSLRSDRCNYYITDLIAFFMTLYTFIIISNTLFQNLPSPLRLIAGVVIGVVTGWFFYIFCLKLHVRLILAIGGFLTLIFNKLLLLRFLELIVMMIFLLPIFSYFLSRKIFRISVLKRYDLVITVFKNVFYNLRIGILVLILSYFFIHLFKDGLYNPRLVILILVLLYFIYSD